MLPPVARLLDELVAAINAPPAQAALGGGVTPAQRGYQQTQTLAEQETAAVWLSPSSWQTLGRAGGLRLDQQLIELRYLRKQTQPDTAATDADVAKADQLRTLLEDFRGQHGGRVERIFGPLTIDRDKLVAPGQSSIGLVLDCDLLTGTAAADEADETGRLTIARQAVWTAIDNYAPLADVFARKYQTAADFAELQLRDPAADELPALAVYWGDIKPEWKTNRDQEWPLTMRLALWLAGDQHTTAERLAEHIFDALYRYAGEGQSSPYIERTLGYPPRRVDELTIQAVTLGRSQQLRALRADVAFTLRSNKDPFGNV